MEEEWSCYRGGQFNGGRIIMLQKWSLYEGRMDMFQRWCLMEGEWSYYRGGQYNEREWSCYGDGQFKGGRIVMFLRWPV